MISFHFPEEEVDNYQWGENQPNARGDCVAVQKYGEEAKWDALNCQDNAVDAYICQESK